MSPRHSGRTYPVYKPAIFSNIYIVLTCYTTEMADQHNQKVQSSMRKMRGSDSQEPRRLPRKATKKSRRILQEPPALKALENVSGTLAAVPVDAGSAVVNLPAGETSV